MTRLTPFDFSKRKNFLRNEIIDGDEYNFKIGKNSEENVMNARENSSSDELHHRKMKMFYFSSSVAKFSRSFCCHLHHFELKKKLRHRFVSTRRQLMNRIQFNRQSTPNIFITFSTIDHRPQLKRSV